MNCLYLTSSHGLLPALAVLPVCIGLRPDPLPPVSTQLGEPLPTTIVVDSLLILPEIKGRYSRPITIRVAETTKVLIKAWPISIWGAHATSVLMKALVGVRTPEGQARRRKETWRSPEMAT